MSGGVVRRARLFEVAVPLREPFRISGGVLRERRSWIVSLEDEDGRVGFGEAAPFEAPFYSAETLVGARHSIVEWLLPRIVGNSVGDAAEVHDRLSDGIRGNETARAGVETACWDLRAAQSGCTQAELVTRRLAELGAPTTWLVRRDHVTCGVALGIPEDRSIDTLVSWTEASLARGYHRIKVKVRPDWDVAPVRAVLQVLEDWGEEVPVTVDANGAYHPERDAERLEELDQLDLLFIEQPFPPDGLWDMAELSHALATPICLDETLTSDDVARQVAAMNGPGVWNIKVQRVGGLEAACRIVMHAVAFDAHVWIGTMPETGLGAQTALALGCHSGFAYPSDLEPSERWYAPNADLIELEMDEEGRMPVPAERRVPDASRLRMVYDSDV